MDPELRELYQEVILDHNKRPRNFGRPEDATNSAEGHNPLCGDHVRVHVHLEGDRVTDVAFEGQGCAISVASASLMTEAIKGKSAEEAHALCERFQQMVRDEREGSFADEGLDELDALAGVKEFPVRVKCATLAWHTLEAALKEKDAQVSTE
jgi:nitrogen fixation protein NifU and related proteins